MHAFIDTTGAQAWYRKSSHLANREHKCDHADCPFSWRIDVDQEYVKHVVIVQGDGIYTERYHAWCNDDEFGDGA